MPGRRMLLIVAVLMGLTALAASLVPRDASQPREGRTGLVEPVSPSPSAAPERAAGSDTVTATLTATEGAKPRRVRAQVGDLVQLTVRGDVLDAVSVAGLTDEETLDPKSPARLQLYAARPGVYDIELLEAGRRIGRLEVRES